MKSINVILCLFLLCAAGLYAASGDVNNSGTTDIVDALMVAQYYVGLNPQGFNAANADINNDGSINIVDALMVAQIYVGLITPPPSATPTPAPEENIYMFSYFTGDGDDGLHLAYSYDCRNFTALNNNQSLLTPVIGDNKMRDPSIQKDANGVFHMVWTDTSWTEMGEDNPANKGIGYASSTDLINWSTQRFLGVMEGTRAENCWAPELFWDDINNVWMIVWSSTVPPTSGHRIYYTTTTDFYNFTPSQILYDPGYTLIDGAIIKYSTNRYAMFWKDETSKDIWIVESNSPRGPWGSRTLVYTQINAEGPAPAKVGNEWYVLYDQYSSHTWGMSRSSNLTSWSTISCSLPSGARHGTIFKISEALLNSLRSTVGG